MDNLKAVMGRIAEDPALSAPVGMELHFAPMEIAHDLTHRACWLQNLDSFQGILLSLHFGGGNGHSVEGSAVLVGPGIAMCAVHVIEPHLQALMASALGVICAGITPNGLQIWRINKVSVVGDTDLAILGLSFASELPSDHTFYMSKLTTRLPKVGEKLLVAGFRADGFIEGSIGEGFRVMGNVLACVGQVTNRYPSRRDSFSLRWPTLEVDCPSWGGMSGGPVFDSHGLLVGLLTSSFETDLDPSPSYVSLLWPALGSHFEGGWPSAIFKNRTSLLEMDSRLCSIDDRSAITVTRNADGTTTTSYRIWE